ncbi:Type II CAAX prenyl endopeptidase Rce1-like [Dillenia turbinata]|uniref:Type II CAAX prenyl endopeptidase Rce1-like n=1 Tax=Dillenia turbinata TaxID=194707 RepID=A0AAN8VE20_9MAGN
MQYPPRIFGSRSTHHVELPHKLLSHSLRPSSKFLSPSISRVRVLRDFPRTCFSICRTSRIFEPLSRPSKLRWRFSCFRHEEEEKKLRSEVSEAEFLEDRLRQEELEQEQSSDAKTDWLWRIQKATDAVFCAKPWTVPWTAKTILQVMLLWIASFWFVGSWIIPFLAHTAGQGKEALTYRGQAMYSLQMWLKVFLGLLSFIAALQAFIPFHLTGSGSALKETGSLMFAWDALFSSVEQSIVARDPVAMALYAIVVSVCAPVWEEIVFRGFLLPSLTKYMPVWCSILVSSVAFALAHFNAQRMLPLVFLGVVMGAVFARSRNLLTSMLLHSLWNAFVFLDLMK